MSEELYCWRHPAPLRGLASGRCVGRWDVPVDRRKAKRLAHRVRRLARLQGLPRAVWTSSLQRCFAVGRWLRRFGFVHHVDDDLLELDFGSWEGRAWSDIGVESVVAWESDFLHNAPGGGEPLANLLDRVRRFLARRAGQGPTVLIAHAGWINALNWLASHPDEAPTSTRWPMSPRYGALMVTAPAASGGKVRP